MSDEEYLFRRLKGEYELYDIPRLVNEGILTDVTEEYGHAENIYTYVVNEDVTFKDDCTYKQFDRFDVMIKL